MLSRVEIWPPLLTPFTADGAVDMAGIDALVEFYVGAGVDGLLVNGLSGEPFKLTPAERQAIRDRVVKATGGRIELAGVAYADVDGDWGAAVSQVHDAGIGTAVLITSLLVPQEEPDLALKRSLETIVEATEGDLGLYEAPKPYKRLIGTEALTYAAQSGRFTFLKDTCCDLERIKQRLALVSGSRLRLHNAQVATFRDSILAGADGFCGLMANVFPAEMRDSALSGDVGLAELLTVGDCALEKDYPSSAKLLLSQVRGVAIGSHSRTLNRQTTREECLGLFALAHLLEQRSGH